MLKFQGIKRNTLLEIYGRKSKNPNAGLFSFPTQAIDLLGEFF
jgi:hypothetical protein